MQRSTAHIHSLSRQVYLYESHILYPAKRWCLGRYITLYFSLSLSTQRRRQYTQHDKHVYQPKHKGMCGSGFVCRAVQYQHQQ